MQHDRLGQQPHKVSLGQVQTKYGTLSAMHALQLLTIAPLATAFC